MDTRLTDQNVVSDVPAADTSPAPKSKKLDQSSTEGGTENEQTATEPVKGVTETAAAQRASAVQVTVKDTESAADASHSTKPADHPETPRPVKRDSLGADKTSDPSHRGNGGRAATAGSSSDSSSIDSAVSGGGSSDGDSGGSE